jgi:radical SAM protein with 4Fe4S-binding SPASM domain
MNTVPSTYLFYPQQSNDYQVLFHPTLSSWIIVNPTAATIVPQLFDGYSIERISKSLADAYSISLDQAFSDVISVYDTLNSKGFHINSSSLPMTRTPHLKSIFIHITRRCNLRCPHCYVNADHNAKDLPTSWIIDLIDILSAKGGNNLTISGGEPLLHPDIEKILLYASSKLTVRLLTNGTKISDRMARLLADNGIYIQISLDGSTSEIHDAIRGQGTYEQIMQAIQRIQDYGAGSRLNLCATLMQANQSDWPDIIKLAEKKHIPLLRFLHSRNVGRAIEQPQAKPLSATQYESFIAHIASMQSNHRQKVELTCGMSGLLLKMPEDFQADDIWCPVGRMIVIDTNGDVYPCVLMMRDDYLLGNIFHQPIDQMIQSDAMKHICAILSNRRNLIKKCSTCAFKNLCQSGCMGQALDHRNSLMETDVFCPYRQKAYARAFDQLIEMAASQ